MKSFRVSYWSCIQIGLMSIAVAIVMTLTVAKPSYAAPVDDYFTAIKNDNDGAVVTLLFRGLDVNTKLRRLCSTYPAHRLTPEANKMRHP